MIVNDVAGFIGPEVFRTGEQLERACLEDIVMAKLHGLDDGARRVRDVPHGHRAGRAAARHRAHRRRAAAPAYLMAVAGNADPMLGYLTTSFREHPRLRRLVRRRPASPMVQRLESLGVPVDDGERLPSSPRVVGLYAAYVKAGGDRRTLSALEDEGRRRLQHVRERGFDVGGNGDLDADARVDALYSHARQALYATLDDGVVRDATDRPVRVGTTARDRDDYLAHPPSGEALARESAQAIRSLYPARPPQVQMVISDGLNANAVNEPLRASCRRSGGCWPRLATTSARRTSS